MSIKEARKVGCFLFSDQDPKKKRKANSKKTLRNISFYRHLLKVSGFLITAPK